MNKFIKATLVVLVISLPYVGLFAVFEWHRRQVQAIENASIIIISKDDMTIRVIDYKGSELFKSKVATGSVPGNKLAVGDMKTPEGIFAVSSIENATNWKHDFGDGLGKIKGAYGSHFIRLYTPGHKGIGIHGTHLPQSIGSRATEGCIRLKNEDLVRLLPLVSVGDVVVVSPGVEDVVKTQI